MVESLINDENKVASNYDTVTMQFKQIGDSIQGTLVDRRLAEVPKFKAPDILETKWVYEVKVPAGATVVSDGESVTLEEETRYTVWGVALINGTKMIRKSIDDQLRTAPLGQIVAIKCTSTRKNKYGTITKIVTVYKKDNVIDSEWLDTEEAKSLIAEDFSEPETPDFTEDNEAPSEDSDVVEPPQEPDADEEPFSDTLSEILTLTKTLFGVKEDKEAIAKAIEVTDLAFIKTNYDAILAKLKTL